MGNTTTVPVCKAFRVTASTADYNLSIITTATPPTLAASVAGNLTAGGEADAEARGWQWFEVAITVLCILGVVGNLLNLAVLSSRRMSADRIGRSMNLGLVTLAVSDMLFCVVVFPYTFITQDLTPTTRQHVYRFYYRVYGIALINLFMMCGTWIVTLMSVSRYVGVVHPLRARHSVCTTRTPLILAAMFVTTGLVTLPYFAHLRVAPCTDQQLAAQLYEIRPTFSPQVSARLVFYIRWVWPVAADFLPLLLLLYCNTRLVRELHRTSHSRKATCPGQAVKSPSNRVTITLVAVVLMLLIFVSPAEFLKYINPYKSWGEAGFVVANVANVMQAVNFSSNFLLYCAVNPKFRAAAKQVVLDMCCRGDGGAESSKRTMSTTAGGRDEVSTGQRWAARSVGGGQSAGASYRPVSTRSNTHI